MIEGETLRRVSGAGVELAVAEAGDARRPTVVLIHGYPDTKEMWSGVTARLAADLHVVAYDVRGAGDSEAPRRSSAYGLDFLGADFLSVARAVAPGRRVHVVGHDWGAIQAWELATNPRYAGPVASVTAIAGPSLDQVAASGMSLLRVRNLGEALRRGRRSWYILLLCLPGGPSLMWRLWLQPDRWARLVAGGRDVAEGAKSPGGRKRREGEIAGDGNVARDRDVARDPDVAEYPTRSLVRDALNGANLYRHNIPGRLLRPRRPGTAHVPVLLVIPGQDRFISPSYYELAERYAPGLRREIVGGSHWLPRTHPEQIAALVLEHARRVEALSDAAAS